MNEPRWRTLLGRVRAIQMELKRRTPARPFGLAGNPAAPASAVAIAEVRLGRRLPPTYREFLEFSDGWPAFYEGASLLGTAEVGRPACLDPETARHGHQVDGHQVNRALDAPDLVHLLAFGADAEGRTLFAFDTRGPAEEGELPVVAWVGGLGMDYRCFTDFLAAVLGLCRTELASLPVVEEGDRAPTAPSPGQWLEVG